MSCVRCLASTDHDILDNDLASHGVGQSHRSRDSKYTTFGGLEKTLIQLERYRSSGQTAASHNRVERVLVATLHDEEVPAIRHERFDLGRVVRRVAAGLVELLARCEDCGDSGVEALLVAHSLTLGIRAREETAERS